MNDNRNNTERTEPSTTNERKPTDRRAVLRREQDMIRRLAEVEELARANRRELELQFRRIADMQVEIDRLSKRSVNHHT
jgi:hypothetical protein